MDGSTQKKTPLDELEIDWVDEWVCEDSSENRRALREGNRTWVIVKPDDGGDPTGLIEVWRPEIHDKYNWDRMRGVLVDPKDPWSDYIPVLEIPPETTGLTYWIHSRAEKIRKYDEQVEAGVRKTKKRPYEPTRCTSIKRDGSRCWGWATDEKTNGHCRAHAPGAMLAAERGHSLMVARLKLEKNAPRMADILEELAETSSSDQVRLKAAETILDRAGLGTSSDLNVNGSVEIEGGAATVVRERLDSMIKRLEAGKREEEADEIVIEEADIETVPNE